MTDRAFPAHGHPDGTSGSPWFSLRNERLYPAHGHPDGTSGSPWFSIAAILCTRRMGTQMEQVDRHGIVFEIENSIPRMDTPKDPVVHPGSRSDSTSDKVLEAAG